MISGCDQFATDIALIAYVLTFCSWPTAHSVCLCVNKRTDISPAYKLQCAVSHESSISNSHGPVLVYIISPHIMLYVHVAMHVGVHV